MSETAKIIERTSKSEKPPVSEPVEGSAEAPPAPVRAAGAPKSDLGVLVPARFSEIGAVHAMLMDAINDSPYYCDEFKSFECARLTPAFLAALHRVDPRHVMTIRDKGAIAGFMLSGPEFGVLWQYWNYIDPKYRSGTLAMRVMRTALQLWDNGRFHKIMTYSRPENKVSIALMERYRYQLVANIKQRMFGEDYLLYEYPLTKALPGYDHGIGVGKLDALRYQLRRLLPF